MTYQTTFEPTFLVHESGTKFYEAIAFNNPDTLNHFVVRRWGKMNTKGEIKIEMAKTTRGSMGLKERAIESKMQRGYSVVSSNDGLHGRARTFDDVSALKTALFLHYGTDNAVKVAGALGVFSSLDEVINSDVPDFVPQGSASLVTPPIDRGQHWGSW